MNLCFLAAVFGCFWLFLVLAVLPEKEWAGAEGTSVVNFNLDVLKKQSLLERGESWQQLTI